MPIASTSSTIARAKALAIGQTTPSLSGGFYPLPDPQMTHPENTTVFIGGLPGTVGRDELEAIFQQSGEVTYINIPPSRGCGFISFDSRPSAEWAIEQLQGFWLHGAQLRLSWGKSQVGDKPRQQDLASMIRSDMPFFTQMLGLSGEQQVKLGLWLEFAQGGNLGRLKDIMTATDGVALGGNKSNGSGISRTHPHRATPPTSSLPLPTSSCSCAPFPASRHDPYQSHGDLCRHYDRLVSDASPISTDIPASPPAPSLTSGQSNTSPPWPTSPRRSESLADSSISSEAVFRAFQPKSALEEHRHSESCITPMRLMELDRENRGKDGQGPKGGDISRLGWGMSQMGLNVAAGEWRPGAGNGVAGRRW